MDDRKHISQIGLYTAAAVVSEITKTLFLFFRIDHYETISLIVVLLCFTHLNQNQFGTDSKYISRKIRPIRICQLTVGILNNNDIVNKHANEIVATNCQF